MSFAVTPKTKGDEEKVGQALRRLHEEDPTLVLRRDPQTGEQLLSGMSQMHVEVAVERLKRRFGVEVELHQPRVPYLETIASEARAQGRYKKQTGGRGQFGDCHDRARAARGPRRLRVRRQDRRRRDPAELPARGRQGHPGGDGCTASSPARRCRASASRSSTARTTPSTRRRWRSRSPARWRSSRRTRRRTRSLLEPIMELEVTVPDEAVGAVNGDLNSRRGRLLGMEPAGGMTTIRAEVPMAEVLTYSQSLTSLTGGRGDYHMHFLRYEEVPAHIAQKLIEERQRRRRRRRGSELEPRTRSRFRRRLLHSLGAGREASVSRAVERLAASRNYWIGSTRADGRPHVSPCARIWIRFTSSGAPRSLRQGEETSPSTVRRRPPRERRPGRDPRGRAELLSSTPGREPSAKTTGAVSDQRSATRFRLRPAFTLWSADPRSRRVMFERVRLDSCASRVMQTRAASTG